MPFSRLGSRRRAVAIGAAVALAIAAPASVLTRNTLPASFTNSEFWLLVDQMSEPSRVFVTNSGSPDNLLSNENGLSTIASVVAERVTASGVYLGVGPEQNFTYISATRPRIAFITDIRRGNLHLHLMYKALFEMSADRAEFVGRLFSRARPSGLTARLTAAELMAAYVRAAPLDARALDANLEAITSHLTGTRGLPLSPEDVAGLAYVYRTFHRFGPNITFTSSIGRSSGAGTYARLMSSTDATGAERSYLANETNFMFVKSLHSRNLIVPVVGDFAGQKALRAIAAFLRTRDAPVSAFYVSNVEMYLQRDGVWDAFCANVASLPLDNTSVFIRPTGSRLSLSSMAAEAANCR